MNERMICFIICSNDELYTQECLYYINHLSVPEGYEVDALTIKDACSMTAGYNEGMQYSEAKYKVYLHQDVFIINRDFIQNCLDIFQKDEKIGMIGMVGAKKLHASGTMWKGKRCGKIYEQHIFEHVLYTGEEEIGQDYAEVEVIDGLMMVTQYDIPWREDLFDKWDFYDCSQSMEFARRGYKVAVPNMDEPWCVHDCGLINVKNYNRERIKFVNEYLVNEKKIEIIAASNNQRYWEECLKYIHNLNIPEGYELSCTNITDAVSMTSAYNEAMYHSDAKYKIYIHQDTFMIYRDLLLEMVHFFERNPQVGMIGVLGRIGDNPSGDFWNSWNCGRCRGWDVFHEIDINTPTSDVDQLDVTAVDGMFMATQYDVRWREDVISGWDFYDISQCCEFIRQGYRVAVPYQKEIWCLHDCGHSKLKQYDAAKKNFCEVYSEFGYRYQKSEAQDGIEQSYTVLESVLQLLPKLIEQNEFAAAEIVLEKASEVKVKLTELSVAKQILEIRKLEQKISGYSLFWEGCHSYEELMEKYTEIKFGLRRLEYGIWQEDSPFERWYADGKLSKECIIYMIDHCIYEKDNILGKIIVK